jgi:quinoprotein glucose dehydrogenase
MRRTLLPFGVIVVVALGFWTLAGRAADKNRDWAAYGGDKGGMKYSPLDQINKDTVKNLKIAWRKSGVPDELKASFPDANAPANYQHTPLMVDGVLYMSSSVGAVVALDPATGKTLWFDSLPPRPDGQGPARGGSTRASRTGPTAATRASSPTSAPISWR